MITGDHKLTAKPLQQLGIITSEEDLILSGTKLAELSEKEFWIYSGTCSCLCPCEPRAKIKNY
jgi:magnesium-transporting ATPase (P-type)